MLPLRFFHILSSTISLLHLSLFASIYVTYSYSLEILMLHLPLFLDLNSSRWFIAATSLEGVECKPNILCSLHTRYTGVTTKIETKETTLNVLLSRIHGSLEPFHWTFHRRPVDSLGVPSRFALYSLYVLICTVQLALST